MSVPASPLAAPERAAPGKDGRWQAAPGFGVYVHIPFCAHRCHYCDFNTFEGLDDLHRPYIEALIRSIEAAHPGRDFPVATSIFFGGGTPTLLPAAELGRILAAVGNRLSVGADAEITVEANPETVDERYFAGLLEAGFNRVSIGVQSLAPGVLERLGRTHSGNRALAALRAARAAGVPEVNGDLIYGSPWESDDDWARSLAGVLEADTDHISAYALTVEEGTPLHTLVATRRVPDVDPDLQAARHAVASETLSAAGFERYEVSNWAKPNRASAHNVLYWCAGDYLGFGAGAHGHLSGRRYWNERLPRDFIAAAGHDEEAGGELLNHDSRAGEALMLGLRLAAGIDVAAFERRWGRGPLSQRAMEIARLEAAGLLKTEGDRLWVPEAKVMLSSEVASSLL